jgi:hypothetical protein
MSSVTNIVQNFSLYASKNDKNKLNKLVKVEQVFDHLNENVNLNCFKYFTTDQCRILGIFCPIWYAYTITKTIVGMGPVYDKLFYVNEKTKDFFSSTRYYYVKRVKHRGLQIAIRETLGHRVDNRTLHIKQVLLIVLFVKLIYNNSIEELPNLFTSYWRVINTHKFRYVTQNMNYINVRNPYTFFETEINGNIENFNVRGRVDIRSRDVKGRLNFYEVKCSRYNNYRNGILQLVLYGILAFGNKGLREGDNLPKLSLFNILTRDRLNISFEKTNIIHIKQLLVRFIN